MMKCTKCGAEFDEGFFCPECGTKIEMEDFSDDLKPEEVKQEKKEQVEVASATDNLNSGNQGKIMHIESENENSQKTDESEIKVAYKEKFPWYLSIWFIVIICILTLGWFCVPGIILGIIRIYKKKAASNNLLSETKKSTISKMKMNEIEEENEEKVPWWLSIWFIVLISVLTFWIFWIPGVVLGIMRFITCKKKRISTVVIITLLTAPYVIAIGLIVSSVRTDNQVDAYIENGQYEDAKEYIEKKYSVGSSSYADKYAKLYMAQGMYDEAVDVLVEYCNNEYEPINIPDYRIEELNKLVEQYKNELQPETLKKVQNLINNKEIAKEAEEAEKKAVKEAEEAEKKAAKEAEEAEKKAAKETEETEKKAAKEAEERAAKEAEEATEKNEGEKEVPNDNFITIGDTFFNDDHTLVMTVIDVGYRQFDNSCTVYVAFEIENNTDKNLYFDQSDGILYFDDYEVSRGTNISLFQDNGYFFGINNVRYPTVTSANAGRKGQIVYMAEISKSTVTENTEIELDVSGAIIKLDPGRILAMEDYTQNMQREASYSADSITGTDGSAEMKKILAYVPEETYFLVDNIDSEETYISFWYDMSDGKEKSTFIFSGKTLFEAQYIEEMGDGSFRVANMDDYKFTFYDDGSLFVYSDSLPDVIGWWYCE